MAVNGIQVGNVGTSLQMNVKNDDGTESDLSLVTQVQVLFKKPDQSVTTKTGGLVTNGSDGKIRYVTVDASDLDQAGRWAMQGKLTFSGGGIRYTTVVKFKVKANLA